MNELTTSARDIHGQPSREERLQELRRLVRCGLYRPCSRTIVQSVLRCHLVTDFLRSVRLH